MAELPHERSLVERLEGRPFVLLGINSDEDRESVKKFVVDENITWRSWWDGGSTKGPIAIQWNVSSWPSLFLIDADGVIRYKGDHLRRIGFRSDKDGKDREFHYLDEAVDSLLKELARKK